MQTHFSNLATWTAAAVLALAALGCGANPPAARPQGDQPPIGASRKQLPNPLAAARPLVAKVNQFGFRLAANSSPDQHGNALLSPYSVYMGLAQVNLGAAGPTRATLEEALGLESITEDSQIRGLSTLAGVLSNRGEFTTANSIWLLQNLPTNQNFLNRLQEATKAEVNVRPSPSPAVLDEINRWVDAKTRGRINRVFDSLDPKTVVALVNALTFDGDWQTSFDPSQVENRPFRTATGVVQVPALRDTVTVRYAESAAGRMISIPFEEEAFSFLVFLPAETAPSRGGPWLDAKAFTDLAGELGTQEELVVQLPKLNIASTVDLKEPFGRMGLGSIFESADLRLLSPDLAAGSRVDEARHRVSLQLDERGVKAAGAGRPTAQGNTPGQFIVDRPFQYAISHTVTGVLVVLGRCGDPSKVP